MSLFDDTNNDATAFDIYQALETFEFTPQVRSKCVKSLYKTCAGSTLLPRSLHFELPGGAMGDVRYHGGSADVIRHECGNKAVAVKALRPHGLTVEDMRNVSRRSLACIPVRIGGLIIPLAEVLQRGRNLESPPASERIAAAGSDDVRESVCHGF